jgi:hypothetical protein
LEKFLFNLEIQEDERKKP